MGGLLVSALGLIFGLIIFMRLKNMPVHQSMREVSELIYETCKTYLATQGKFLMHPGGLHRGHHRLLFRVPAGVRSLQGRDHSAVQRDRHRRQLLRGGLRHAREHVRQLAHRLRRLTRQAVSLLRHSAAGRHEHRHAAGLGRTADHAVHPAVRPGRPGRPLLHRLRHRRIAGRRGAARGRRHLHQDRRHRLAT